MKLIRFRRLNRPPGIIDGVPTQIWEIAFNEEHLHAKLNGEMAEVIMPPKPWPVRLWRRLFPLRPDNAAIAFESGSSPGYETQNEEDTP